MNSLKRARFLFTEEDLVFQGMDSVSLDMALVSPVTVSDGAIAPGSAPLVGVGVIPGFNRKITNRERENPAA